MSILRLEGGLNWPTSFTVAAFCTNDVVPSSPAATVRRANPSEDGCHLGYYAV
jgi:hypothetical protein